MKNKYCTLYLIRHGETEWNVKKLIQGHTDSPLTKNGLNQAKKLANEFKNKKIDAIFSSDLTRAKRTAEIIALEKKLAVETSELLRERNFGKYEGQTLEDLKKLIAKMESVLQGRESHEEIEDSQKLISRFITYLREIAVAYAGKKIIVVTHGGCLRVLLIHLGVFKEEDLRPGTKLLDNSTVLTLKSDGVDFITESLSTAKIQKSSPRF